MSSRPWTCAKDGAASLERVQAQCFRSLASLPGAQLIETPQLVGVRTHLAPTFFNGVVSFASAPPDRKSVAEVTEFYRGSERGFRWWIEQPVEASIASAFSDAGLARLFDSAGMAADVRSMDLDRPLPADVTIRRLEGRSDLEAWATMLVAGFERPPTEREAWLAGLGMQKPAAGPRWEHWLAYDRGRPVSATTLLIDGDHAGVYLVVTMTDARGRGIGSALLRESLRCAREQGVAVAALQATEMGEPVYRSLGFEQCCRLDMFASRRI
jgi:GNAT superfamily N-acetyltransferase